MTNTKAAHTPGPWTMHDRSAFGDIVIKADGIVHICHVTQDSASFSDGVVVIEEDNQIANAKLIAACPAMYQALKDLDDDWTETFPDGPDMKCDPERGGIHEDHKRIWKNIRAAIAKAGA